MQFLSTPVLSLLVAVGLIATPAQAHFSEGQIWVIDFQNSQVVLINPDNDWFVSVNPLATSAANNPGAMSFNHHGHMMLANYGDNTVIEMDGDGFVETVLTAADGLNGPWGSSGIIIGPGHGDVFITNFLSGEVLTFDEEFGNGSVFADLSDGLQIPTAIAFLADGHMLVADRGANKTIHHFDSNSGLATVFDVLPETPIDLIIRNNGDIYALTNQGNIFRYVGGNSGSRVLLGNYGGPSATGGIDFSPDHDAIYHLSTADASIREIDPGSGSSVVQAILPGSPISLAVVGGQFAPGTYIEFGEALAGTGGVEPTLHGDQEPRIGQVTQIDAHQFVGGSTIFMFLSATMVESDFKGGEFHIGLGPGATFFAATADGTHGVAGDGELSLPFVMPNDPALVGVKLYLQALGVDAGAPFGVSFTPCLIMYIGS
jgi:hypothetical protein